MAQLRAFVLPILLGASFISAIASALMHPSRVASSFLESLAACCVLALVLSFFPSRVTVPLVLSTMTIVAAAALGWIAWTQPQDLSAKSPLVAWLPRSTAVGPAVIALSPNVAGLLASISGAGWATVAFNGIRRARPVWSVVAIAGFLAIASLAIVIASGSRAALVALTAGVLAVWLIRQPRRVAIIVTAGLVAVGIGLVIAPAGRSLLSAALADTVASTRWNSFERLEVWDGTWKAIAVSPITGRGIGSFPLAYEAGLGTPDPIGAHNTLLQIWLDLGLLGVASFVALVAFAARRVGIKARDHPDALVMAAAGVAWLVVGVFESTVIGSWRQQEPWFGWQEAVVPLAFALVGVAVAPRDHVVRPPLTVIASLSAFAIVAMSVPLTLSSTAWLPPDGVTDDTVMSAAQAWVRGCATTSAGVPPDCPQTIASRPASQAMEWAPAVPLLEHTSVTWSAAMGLYVVRGNFNLEYAGRCGQSGTPRAGVLHGYFIVGLRPAGDHRNFGADALATDTRQVAGFWVVDRYRWTLRC